ncbi:MULTISPECIES: Dps family protein [Nesterenkonia]|uniref:DNA starvation/stationary phase protection protein n=2 Tax=Nesterenkonia TaxID=57494 RepID=A0A0W8IIG1_9MICC|nr:MULTISPECIES: DNA starvation/stationary phase protection protein [Nesterenkonia]KUG59738.1 DNA starvation/stationary phase protection protein [Nesterenkonia jeotgali]MBA8921940.1 starvation-inducible DNA-binding protein [Nesterenkonia jeotgali]NYJ16501.1 starvation-inducible DNA-binding protein [Nesterenkonia sandarakina]
MTQKYSDYTAPGLAQENGHEIAGLLQSRLYALNDLHLVLKHVHWNVVGPNFIAIHEMLDPQTEVVRGFADEVAERIATLGGSPSGLSGELVSKRHWEDYPLFKADGSTHLAELEKVYDGVIGDHRDVLNKVGELDPITEDLLIGQAKELELFQWFIRSHLDKAGAVS